MEHRIKKYEQFIKKALESGKPSQNLKNYHREMLKNFQHERLVHLIIMWGFIFLTLIFLALTASIFIFFPHDVYLIPVSLVTLIFIVLTAAYIKHYHFLENHIQSLYDLTKDLEL